MPNICPKRIRTLILKTGDTRRGAPQPGPAVRWMWGCRVAGPVNYNFVSDRTHLIIFLFLFFLFFSLFLPLQSVSAQGLDFGVATTYKIDEGDLENGDILSISPGKNILERSKTSYDENMFGVYVVNQKIVYRTPGSEFPVLRSGESQANVTTFNGPIKKGDYITSSEIKGKGQKATLLTGFVLGVSLTDFDGKSGKEITYEGKKYRQGTILLAVGIGPASPVSLKTGGGLFGVASAMLSNLAFNFQTTKDFNKIMRYVIAALVSISAIFINFHTFGKNVTHGIEAIGRNPLAKLSIQSMIIINVVLIGILSLAAIILSIAIVSF